MNIFKSNTINFPVNFGNNKSSIGGVQLTSAARLSKATSLNRQHLLSHLDTNEDGLDEEKVDDKMKQYGKNEIEHDKAPAWFVQLFEAFINPFIIVLLALAAVSLITDVFLQSPENREYKTVIVISVMVLLSTFLRFWQEFRSNKAAEQLKGMVKTTATVLRNELGKMEVDIKELVPGDIIFLSAGDMIPADVRILNSKDLFVSQSILTGEALPVEKRDHVIENSSERSLLELDNICFMGTNVVSGTAMAVVVITGNQTYFGSISKSLIGKRAETAFDKGVNSVSWLLIRFMFVMVPLVFFINGFTKGSWLEALLFAISVAVGLTPEMLPMIVTTNLAKGAVMMSKRKVIVKRLNAIQNIGAMDILCTDKTGTLTLDKIVLERHLNVFGEEDDEVLKWAYLNSFHQTGLKNLLDVAVLESALTNIEVQTELTINDYQKVDEIPFDFLRRRMSVVLEQNNNKHLLICKGAVEEMLHCA